MRAEPHYRSGAHEVDLQRLFVRADEHAQTRLRLDLQDLKRLTILPEHDEPGESDGKGMDGVLEREGRITRRCSRPSVGGSQVRKSLPDHPKHDEVLNDLSRDLHRRAIPLEHHANVAPETTLHRRCPARHGAHPSHLKPHDIAKDLQ